MQERRSDVRMLCADLVEVSWKDLAGRIRKAHAILEDISAAGACWVALQLAATIENATIVFVVCDRGDRYLSTGVFPA